jgi:hypothetical protein
MQQGVVAGVGQAQAPHQAGDAGEVRTEAQGGQDDRQPKKGGGAGADRAEGLESAQEKNRASGRAGKKQRCHVRWSIYAIGLGSEKSASRQKLEQRINHLKAELGKIGPMRPGGLSRQYNVCGKPGCRCKDPKNPRRHGPYYQLNYVHRGKKTSEFVRAVNLKQVRTQLANYKRLRRLNDQLVGSAIEEARLLLKKQTGAARFWQENVPLSRI